MTHFRFNLQEQTMAHDVDSHIGSPSVTAATEHGIRASDADRLATVMVLQDAMSRGLLNPDEASERMAWAFAAVHRRDLDPLTEDLAPAPAHHDDPLGWRALAAMTADRVRLSLADTTGRLGPTKVAVVFLVVLLLVIAVGALATEFMVHASSATGPRGFGHH
jgi:hypothetical protein